MVSDKPKGGANKMRFIKTILTVVALALIAIVGGFAEAQTPEKELVLHVWSMKTLPADLQVRAKVLIEEAKKAESSDPHFRQPARLSRNLGDELICRSGWLWEAAARLCKEDWLAKKAGYAHAGTSLRAKLEVMSEKGGSLSLASSKGEISIDGIEIFKFAEEEIKGRVIVLTFPATLSPVKSAFGHQVRYYWTKDLDEWGTSRRRHVHVIVD